jgi:hypothetical protein
MHPIMAESEKRLWEEELDDISEPSRFRIRCSVLHYLGIIICLVGLVIIIFGLFDPQFHYRIVTPGKDGVDWGKVLRGLVVLLVGGAMTVFIEE